MDIPDKEGTLFIIDDDDVDVMTIERCFKKRRIGNPLIRAEDGQQALEMLNSGAVDATYIILLDLNMPRMDGIEFLRVLRRDPELGGSVIFILTTSMSDEDILAGYKQHIAGYILKGRSGEDFMDIVSLLERYWRMVQLPDNLSHRGLVKHSASTGS